MYFSIDIEFAEEGVELVQALLDTCGALGFEVQDHSLKLPPGTPPLAEGKARLRAYFESEVEADEGLRQIRREFPDAVAQAHPVQQEDWAETWKKHVKPVRVGRLWVGPPWELARAGDAPVKIVIEPGMAFGTGDHPTTEMCLAEIDRMLQRRPGCGVLDVGTGSGVLAIAARKLGARRVVGNDIDPIAVRVAAENAIKNEAAEIELTDKPVERITGQFELVVANLFAGVLVQLAPRIAARMAPEGVLLATGVLLPQATEVAEAFEREGLRALDRRTSGEWVLLLFEKRT